MNNEILSNCLKRKRNKFTISLDDDFAIITHYLQNLGTPFAEPFKEDALKLLGYKDEDEFLKTLKA